jgi:tetratricopeptide (TPR) repeat protein
VLALSVLAATPALADDAESFFAQGRALRAQGKCAEAIVAFRHALELRPQGLGSLRNVAECEQEIGQFASARSDWWGLRRAVLQSNESKYATWEKDAEQAYNSLEEKVAHLTVKVTGAAPERARISVDGKPLDPRLVGVELERDLGPHTIEALYGGASPLSESRTLTAGAHEIVVLDLPAPIDEPAPDVKPEPVVPKGRPALRNAGIASLAVGGAALVGALAAIGVRQSALSSFSVCAPAYQGCPPSLRDEQSKGQTASTLVTAFSVVAGVGVAAGIPLFIVGSRVTRDAKPKPSVGMSLAPLAAGAALEAGGSF